MKEVKIMFIDLDGTLLNNKAELTTFTKEMIKRVVEKGIFVVICSGRANTDTVNRIKEMNTKLVISDNGAMVYNYETDTKIFESNIKRSTLIEIWKFAIKNEVSLTYNGTYHRFKDKNSSKEATIVNNAKEIKEDITQIVATAKEYENIRKVKEYVKENYPEIEAKNLWSQNIGKNKEVIYEMDITNKDNNKGRAIHILLKNLSIDRKFAMCFGDGINDISMFESCDLKVAMKNANKDIKQMANYITEHDNDKEGVARFISKNLL